MSSAIPSCLAWRQVARLLQEVPHVGRGAARAAFIRRWHYWQLQGSVRLRFFRSGRGGNRAVTAYGQKSSSARAHTRADTRPLVEAKKPSGSALRLQALNPHELVPWSYSGCRREAKYDSKSWFQCFGVQLLEKKKRILQIEIVKNQ